MSAEEDWFVAGRFEEEERVILELEEEEEVFNQVIQAQIKELVKENSPRQVNAICPMQLISQVSVRLNNDISIFGQVLYVQGIYKPQNSRDYNGYYYDNLKDENNNVVLKICVPAAIRQKLKPDSLVILCGMATKRIDVTRSSVELQFRVDSIVEEVKTNAIDKDDQKRIELRQRKVAAGFKNVDNILETLLLNKERPRIALVYASFSIVEDDFENGIRAAKSAIDFFPNRISFTQTRPLYEKLKELDQQGYTAIALVRGGGVDSKTDVDKPEVIETVVGMRTPFISGLGHAKENIFLREVADKWTPTPQGLGQYFSELVENVTTKLTNSKAALKKEVEEQFKGQLDAEKKRSDEMQKRIDELNKTHEEALKAKQTSYDTLEEQLKTEKLLRTQLQEKIKDSQGTKWWIYVAIALIALIAGFVIARIMFPPDAYY